MPCERGGVSGEDVIQPALHVHEARQAGHIDPGCLVQSGQERPQLAFPDPYNPGGLYPLVPTANPRWRQPIEELDVCGAPV
jgi:hypothetical protein